MKQYEQPMVKIVLRKSQDVFTESTEPVGWKEGWEPPTDNDFGGTF